ncbi:MAG: hypothetical protein ABI854_05960, partial [Betaproteobacteria bacterium]
MSAPSGTHGALPRRTDRRKSCTQYLAKGKIMHSLPWKISPLRVPFPAATLMTLVSVATAGAFLYAMAVMLAHQRAANTARITAGEAHACELVDGGVRCWGYNTDGELGDSTTMARLAPVQVAGLSAGVTAIASGGYHTCALTGGGAVKCWGRNHEGQLGDSTQAPRLAPVIAAGLSSGVTAIAAGGFHTCALIDSGEVRCWGHNRHGQLGTSTAMDQAVPSAVPGLAGVRAIAAGADHTCAILAGGKLECWGYNYY